jgi:hypothetical protein
MRDRLIKWLTDLCGPYARWQHRRRVEASNRDAMRRFTAARQRLQELKQHKPTPPHQVPSL